MKRPYRPSALIVFSVVLHVFGLVLLFFYPLYLLKVVFALLLNHLLLTVIGLWPKSSLLGPNIVELASGSPGGIYLTFDDGPNPDITPRVLDLLDQYQCRATFFVIGQHAREFPELLREIVRRGHAIGNHSDQHSYTFALQGVRGFRKELEVSQEAIFSAIGTRPRYFRAPFGFRSPLLEPALCSTGLQLMSWTRRGFDTRCESPEKILDRLTCKLKAGDILLLHDGPFGLQKEGGRVVLSVLLQLLEILKQKGLRSDVVPRAYQEK